MILLQMMDGLIQKIMEKFDNIKYLNLTKDKTKKYLLDCKSKFEIIVIDGVDENRTIYLNHINNLLKTNGILIIDDSQRENYKSSLNELKIKGFKEIKFSGHKNYQFENDCTSIFFKKIFK